ncbi:MAG: ArnT family glycosyltransferase [Bacteroidota bacterium]
MLKIFQTPAFLLSLIIVLCASAAGAVLHYCSPESFLFFGDAVSHLVRARQFIDSQQPGLINIGTVWLPLPHLLLIPFVSVDALFYSGTAGAFLGIPLLMSLSAILYHLLAQMTGSTRIAFFIALLFGLNPNILYIAMTPMTEIPLLFFLTAGAFALLQFIRSNRVRWAVLASSAVALATLCRYEAWILAPFLSIVIMSGVKSSQRSETSVSLSRMLLAAVIPWAGIIFWLGWNYLQYGDALKFAHWTFDVGTSAVRTTLQSSPQEMFRILGTAVLWIFGPVLALAGLAMVFSLRRLNRNREQFVILAFCALPMLFTAAAIMLGFVQIDQWWWNWRFVLPFGLFLSVACALVLKEVMQKSSSPVIFRGIIAALFLVPFCQLMIPAFGTALYHDAEKSYDERSRTASRLGNSLHAEYSEGTVALLTGYGVGQRIMNSSNLPLRTFRVFYFGGNDPVSITDRYLIIGKERTPESLQFSEFWNENSARILQTYSLRSEDGYYILLRRK